MYIVLWSMQPYNTGPKQPYAKKYKHQKFVFLWNVMLIFAGFIKININCFLQMFLMWWMAQDEYCVLIFFKQRPMSRAPKKPKIQHDTKISSIIKVDEYWHSHIFVCFAWKKKSYLGPLLSGRIKRVSYCSSLCTFCTFLDKLLVDRLFHVDPWSCCAALALVEEHSLMSLFHGIVHCENETRTQNQH